MSPDMEVYVFAGKYIKRALFGITLIGIAAATAGGVLGVGFGGQMTANASPQTVAPGTLGIGERTIAPLETVTGVEDKITVVGSEHPRTMTRAAVRADAPLPKPVVRRSAGSAVSRSAASGGWSTARASWYGPGFYGRKTASGAVLTEGMMNVAHRSLAFGTRIQFEYNGRTCTAVVNDRGPYAGGRTFDLGPGTAQALGFGGVGTVRYRILGR